MIAALTIFAAVWLALGVWLTLDGMKQVWPHIRADRRPLPAKVFGVGFTLIAGLVCLPARFLWRIGQ